MILCAGSLFAKRHRTWILVGAPRLREAPAPETHVSTTRVPGVPRGRKREIVRRRLRAFLHSDAPTHGPRGSWLAGGPMRANVSGTPTQPASLAGEQRSESPARARGSDARRVCPRVVYGCRSRQAMSRAQRSAPPAGNGTRGRGLGPREPRKARAGPTASIAGVAVAKPRRREGRSRALERVSRGEGPCPTEDTPGRRSEAHRFTRALRAAASAPRKKGDRGVRGSGAC